MQVNYCLPLLLFLLHIPQNLLAFPAFLGRQRHESLGKSRLFGHCLENGGGLICQFQLSEFLVDGILIIIVCI